MHAVVEVARGAKAKEGRRHLPEQRTGIQGKEHQGMKSSKSSIHPPHKELRFFFYTVESILIPVPLHLFQTTDQLTESTGDWDY